MWSTVELECPWRDTNIIIIGWNGEDDHNIIVITHNKSKMIISGSQQQQSGVPVVDGRGIECALDLIPLKTENVDRVTRSSK